MASASKRTSSRRGSCAIVYGARGLTSIAHSRRRCPLCSCRTVTRGTRRSPTTIRRDACRSSTRISATRAKARPTTSGGTSQRDPSRTGGDGERDHPPPDRGQALIEREHDGVQAPRDGQRLARAVLAHRHLQQRRRCRRAAASPGRRPWRRRRRGGRRRSRPVRQRGARRLAPERRGTAAARITAGTPVSGAGVSRGLHHTADPGPRRAAASGRAAVAQPAGSRAYASVRPGRPRGFLRRRRRAACSSAAITTGPIDQADEPERRHAAQQADEHQQPVHRRAAAQQQRAQDVVGHADDADADDDEDRRARTMSPVANR